MKAFDIISEANLGTNPKRPSREGSRPERGHEPQKRYVTDRKTGKEYDPEEEFDKLKNSPEFQAQMKRMAQKEDVAEATDMMAKERRKRLADAEKKKQERLAAEKAKKDKKQQGVAEGSKPTKKEYLKKLDQNRKDIEDTRQQGVYGAPGSLKNVDWVKKQGVAEGFDYTMKDLGNDYAGFPSNHSMKHKMLKRINPEHHQLYKDKMNNTHEFDDLLKLFNVAKGRGHVIDEGRGYFDGMPTSDNDYFRIPDADAKHTPYSASHEPQQPPSKPAKYSVGDIVPVYMGSAPGVATIHPSHIIKGKILSVDPTGDMYAYKIKLEDGKIAHVGDKRINVARAALKRQNESTEAAPNTNRIWAQITDYEKRAKATKNDIRKNHYLKMADELRAKLPTSDNVEEQFCDECGGSLAEHGKASRELCKSSKPDADLGASMLSSCKSQGLRARDGNKSHKLGKDAKSRVKVGGHRIKGQKYGGPLPDWS